MAKLPARLQVIEGAMVLGLIALIGRAGAVQADPGQTVVDRGRVQRTSTCAGRTARHLSVDTANRSR